MTAKRLTRKELLRQDEFLTTMEKAQQIWDEHKNIILISAISVVAVLVLTFGGISFFKAREGKASVALTEALRPYHGAVLGEQSPTMARDDQMQFASETEKYQASVEALTSVVSDYGSTNAGLVAKLYLGHSRFNLGQFAQAREAYDEFRDAAGNSYLAGMALLNSAQCLKMEGDLAGATAAYQELVDSAAALQFPLDTALVALADCRVENGETDQAAMLYRRVRDEFPESSYRFVAEEKLDSLGLEEPAAETP
jgi:tetratricopeptide (TPR) repeat protein